MNLHQRFRFLVRNSESGQAMVEYAIVVALIAVVAIIAVEALGDGIVAVFENIASELGGI
ncbi:MAG: Flp family type IVb pilin [Dehalococcoidia bacterium]|nr:Flp family type IVb pilin [Dehalococcoidia bacterium]